MGYTLLNYFFICDSIERTPNNQINCTNIFNQIGSNVFPCVHDIVYTIGFTSDKEITNPKITIKLMNSTGSETLMVHEETFQLVIEEGKVSTLAGKIPNVTFPEPGKYRFTFQVNEDWYDFVKNYLPVDVMLIDDKGMAIIQTEVMLKELLNKHFTQ